MCLQRTKLLITTIIACFATLIMPTYFRPSAHADNIKHVGSWEVNETHPDPAHDPGREKFKLTAVSGDFNLDLWCLGGGPWRLFISEFSGKDTADQMSSVKLIYSIDGERLHTIEGTGHKRYRFEIHHDANAFVGALINAKKTLSFAIEPRKRLTVMAVEKAREAITPYFDRCPIDPQ